MTNDANLWDLPPAETVDVAVLGGGAAGLNAALMLARSRRSVVVLDHRKPRNAPAQGVHGLLGREGVAPSELVATGRAEVRSYGGQVVQGEVQRARALRPADDGDLRFGVTLSDGTTITARRLIIATGAHDVLPPIAGLAQHWGRGLVHCPYCHGWEVRDEPIGIIATGPMSAHQALLFRQLTDDVTVFARGVEFDPTSLERFAALDMPVITDEVTGIEAAPDGGIAGVRLNDGRLIERRVLAVGSTVLPNLDGLEDLGLAVDVVGDGIAEQVVSGMGGQTEVPGVWAAGNVTDPMAQVGSAAAGGALAGAHVNAALVMAEADAAVVSRLPA